MYGLPIVGGSVEGGQEEEAFPADEEERRTQTLVNRDQSLKKS